MFLLLFCLFFYIPFHSHCSTGVYSLSLFSFFSFGVPASLFLFFFCDQDIYLSATQHHTVQGLSSLCLFVLLEFLSFSLTYILLYYSFLLFAHPATFASLFISTYLLFVLLLSRSLLVLITNRYHLFPLSITLPSSSDSYYRSSSIPLLFSFLFCSLYSFFLYRLGELGFAFFVSELFYLLLYYFITLLLYYWVSF